MDDLNLILEKEEAFWQVRSNWLMQGDRNTFFFHLSTIIRRNSNRILMLKDDVGNSITDHNEIDLILLFLPFLFGHPSKL